MGGKSQESNTLALNMIKEFYKICASKNITPSVKYVNTAKNPADYPSRNMCEVPSLKRYDVLMEHPGLFKKVKNPFTIAEALDFW